MTSIATTLGTLADMMTVRRIGMFRGLWLGTIWDVAEPGKGKRINLVFRSERAILNGSASIWESGHLPQWDPFQEQSEALG